ncbi:MAG: aromatic amino acid transaminase, partial [Halioglobus sp.]
MLQSLEPLPADPILGLSAACRADSNPDKVDLTIGIYMDEQGVCPVFEAVQQAQREIAAEELTKAYLPPAGDEAFNQGLQRLVLGADSAALADGRVSSIQTPGGCGALRIGAEIIHAASPDARVWVSDPTWPVHLPLLGSVGLEFATYRYYEPSTHGVNFDGMVEDLKKAQAGDVVLLHGCCHNPCGADLSLDQWEVVTTMAETQGFTPFIDLAYQGLGDGLDEDAAGLRMMVSRLPEVLVAASCSKNLGLYRERTGAAIFVCNDSAAADAVLSQSQSAARRVYSMPPAHGALLAGRVLN